MLAINTPLVRFHTALDTTYSGVIAETVSRRRARHLAGSPAVAVFCYTQSHCPRVPQSFVSIG